MSDNPSFPVATASVSWFDSSNQLHIRVYSTDGYTVTERCMDGNGWTTGFSMPGSDVSATVWNASDGAHIRVYATFEDTTTEWCFDPGSGWNKGQYTPS
ncbi:MAG TPA: hypothetical protein VM662_12465 [Sphingomonas sp.]|nr:hypothetical protein [Sphingomonas sp.]